MQPAFHHIVGQPSGGGGDIPDLAVALLLPSYEDNPGDNGLSIIRWYAGYTPPEPPSSGYPNPPVEPFTSSQIHGFAQDALVNLGTSAPTGGQAVGVEWAASSDGDLLGYVHSLYVDDLIYTGASNSQFSTIEEAFTNPIMSGSLEIVYGCVGYFSVTDSSLYPAGRALHELIDQNDTYEVRIALPRYQIIRNYPF